MDLSELSTGSSNGADLLVAPAGMPEDPPSRSPAPPPDPTLTPHPHPRVQAAAYVAAQRDPERWAKVMDLAKRFNLQPDFADRNFDELSKADQRNRVRQETTDISPTLANWLSDSDNATIGKHEIAPLARVDKGARLIGNKPDEGGFDYAPTIGVHDLTASAGSFAAAYGMGDPHRIAETVAAANKRARELRAEAPDYTREFSQAMQAHGGDVTKAFRAWLASQDDNGRSGVQHALDSFKTGARTLGETISMIGAAASRPRGLAYQTLEGLPSSVPFLALAAGGAAAGNVPGLIGGALIGGMLPSVGAEINSELEKRGIDVTDPDALERAYRDPALMDGIRQKAARRGVTSSMVNAFVAPLGGKFLEMAGEAATVGTKALATAADVSVQAAGVGAGDIAGQRAAGEPVDVGQAIQSSISTLGFAFGAEAIGAGRRGLFHSDPTKAAVQATSQANDALAAQHHAQALAEIGTAVSEAKTTQLVPERLKSLVEMATGNDENAQVYFQTKDWDEHFQAAGASPAKAFADIVGGDGKAYYDAKATGAALSIPLSDYVARVAPTEHWGKLLEFARTKPDGMSLLEATDYLTDLPKTMQEIATEAGAEKEPAVATAPEASAAKVRENVETQLKEAGVTPSIAKAQSSIYEAAFRTLGERAGVDPLDLFNRYMLRIRGETTGPAETRAPAVPLSPEETAARGELAGKAESAVERAGMSLEKPDPYAILSQARNTSLKTSQGEHTYARTASGRLRSNLGKVSVDGLIDEYSQLLQSNTADQSTAIPSVIPDENFHTFSDGRAYVGMKRSAVNASGRIAQRVKSIAKLDEELKARGVTNVSERLYDHMNARGTADFSFEQAAAPWSGSERSPEALAHPAAYQNYQNVVAQIMDLHNVNRSGLLAALRAPPDILNLKQDARGRITIGEHGVEIKLLAEADRSTFLHETAHFYMQVMGDLAKGPNAAPEIVSDLGTIRTWLGADEGAKLTRDQHEQFAKGFEAYLMEGKAPSPELRNSFYRFKRWLVEIYKSVNALGVDLTPEVRRVFDRLLAVDSEIARAEEDSAAQPLFADPAAVGMSTTEADSYQRAIQDAYQAAEEQLTVRMMKQIRREESSEWKGWRGPIENDVTGEVNRKPEYRAIAFMKDEANPDGTPLAEGTPTFKLSREAVKADYGDEAATALPHGVTGPDGLHPDLVAEVFGFKSGRELVDAITKAPAKEDLIKSVTDARMQLEHGERLSEFQVKEAAAEALQNEKRSLLFRKQAEILASDHFAQFTGMVKKITRLIPPTEAVKAEADRIVSQKSVKDLRPSVYNAAVNRLMREAQDKFLKGDYDGAFNAQLKALLTNEVFRAATDAKAEIEGALDDWKKFFRPDEKLSKTRDMDLLNAGRSILASFGVGSSDKPAASYLEQIRSYDSEMYDAIAGMVNDATSHAGPNADYRNLSYEDFQALAETASSLWNLSKRVNQIEVDGVKRNRREVRDELIARATELRGPGELPGYKQAVTDWEKTKIGLLAFKAVARRVEHWVRGFDGGAADGVGRRYLWNRVSDAATAFRVAKKSSIEDYAEFLKGLEDMPITRSKIPAPEIGYTFSGHNELLGALLHTGNESNLAKLLVGRGWGAMQEHTIGAARSVNVLDTSKWDALTSRLRKEGVLTKAHYDYLQGVWDRFEGLKPEAQTAHKEQFGHYFAEITTQPFSNEFGNFKGGYYPAKPDPLMVSDAQARDDQAGLLGSNNGFMHPSVGRGFTKERVESYRKPLILDASAVPQHFDAELRFIHMGPAIRDVARVVMDPAFREAFSALDPTIVHDALVPWLRRAGQQLSEEVAQGGRFWSTANKVARSVRSNAALQIMAANSTVLLEQITHFPSVLVRVDKGKLANATWNYVRNHADMTKDIADRSDFMATRESAAMTEARTQATRILLDPTVFQNVRDFSQAHGRFLMTGVQSIMDHVVWQAMYDQMLEKGVTEHEATREADAQVRELLGSYSPEDVSAIEAGTPIQRLFTMFYGFFNTKLNVLETETTIASQVGLKKGSGRLTGAAFWSFMIPALMGSAIKTAMAGQAFQEDDEGTLHMLLRHFGLAQIEMAGRMVPFAGTAVTAAEVKFGHGHGSDQLLNSPAIKMLGDAFIGSAKDLKDLTGGKDLSSKDITDFFTLIGMVTGLPLRPLAKPIGYLHDVHTGKAQPSSRAGFTRGLLTGR